MRKWFYEYDPDMWDKEIEKDAASGKLDLVAEKSILLSKENETKEL